MNMTVEMPEYPLISELSTVDNVESVNDEIANIFEFDELDNVMFIKKKKYKALLYVRTTSNILRPEIIFSDTVRDRS